MSDLLPQESGREDRKDALLLSAVSFNGRFREEPPASQAAPPPLYQSRLKVSPPALDLEAMHVGFEIKIKGQGEPVTRLLFHNAGEQFELILNLDQAWDAAGKYIQPSDQGYACLTLPYPNDQTHRPRLHVATLWGDAVFDRVMEVVKLSSFLLWEDGLMDGLKELEIVAEPLGPRGVKQREIGHMGFAIGSSWLNTLEAYFFSGYTTWRPRSACFDQSFFYPTGLED